MSVWFDTSQLRQKSSQPSGFWKDFNRPLAKLSKTDIQGRFAAVEALTAYGNVLTTLIDSKSQDSDFSSAATSLAGAIKGLPPSVLSTAGITGGEIDAVGQVVVALGEIGLDVRRRQVLQDVVPAAEPVVTKICRMLGTDFNVKGDLLATIAGDEPRDALVVIENTMSKHGNTMEARAILLPLYQKVASISKNAAATYGALKDAANSCATASVKLARAIDDPKYTAADIIDFVTKAQAAYDAIKSVSGQK